MERANQEMRKDMLSEEDDDLILEMGLNSTRGSIQKTIKVNNGYSQTITIPHTLGNKFKLKIVSDVMKKGKSTKKYLEKMHAFAYKMLSPWVNRENGSRNIDLTKYFEE
jgi:hypothetical protein